MITDSDEMTERIREVLGVRESSPILNRGFELTELAIFALVNEGWADSNGGFGVIYPGDLDDFDKNTEGMDIPDGYVEIYGFWGKEKGGYEFRVKKDRYIQELIWLLKREGYSAESKALEFL